MNAPRRGRSLGELAREQAPLPPRRAAAVMVAVLRCLERSAVAEEPPGPAPEQVLLVEDGSAELLGPGTADCSPGASLGRLWFLLLVGRLPLGPQDAFEPHLRASLDPAAVALLARACAEEPGRWPSLAEWAPVLADAAGTQAAPISPRERAAGVRRAVLLAVALAVLALLSVAVVLAAPRWWDAATREEGAGAHSAAQAFARS